MNIFIVLTLIIILALHYLNPLQRSDYIPLNIWQTYKTDQLPEKAKACQQSWKEQKNYHYQFMDDPQVEQFIREHFPPRVHQVFKRFPLGVMKADLWRYCILFIHGGIYSDIDSVALKPISDWKIKPQDGIIIGLENDLHFCQWTILAEPRHPILQTVIQMITDDAEKGIDTSDEHFVHKHTGPGIWTRAIHRTLGFPEDQKAATTYALYKDPKTNGVFKTFRVRLEDVAFFSKEKVRNLYGSTQFGDGYTSWMDERNKILSNNK